MALVWCHVSVIIDQKLRFSFLGTHSQASYSVQRQKRALAKAKKNILPVVCMDAIHFRISEAAALAAAATMESKNFAFEFLHYFITRAERWKVQNWLCYVSFFMKRERRQIECKCWESETWCKHFSMRIFSVSWRETLDNVLILSFFCLRKKWFSSTFGEQMKRKLRTFLNNAVWKKWTQIYNIFA